MESKVPENTDTNKQNSKMLLHKTQCIWANNKIKHVVTIIPLSITASKEAASNAFISRTSISKSVFTLSKSIKTDANYNYMFLLHQIATLSNRRNQQNVNKTKRVLHLSWGRSEYFLFIVSITTEEISILTTSSYPSSTIPSLNAASKIWNNKNQTDPEKKKCEIQRAFFCVCVYLSFHSQWRGLGDYD